MVDRIFKFFCSLRLTVVLLCAGLVLVFVGTLAQVHEGLFQAQVRYFKSWYVWRPTIGDSAWPILLPGGYLLGTMLLLNLFAAHVKRFQFTWKKFGINLIHFGIVLLLLGQLLTDVFSRESAMTLFEGMSSNYSEDFRANELTFIDTSEPDSDNVVSIPESRLKQKGEITDAALPATVRVLNYWPNCDINEIPPAGALHVAADHGMYTNYALFPVTDSSPASDDIRPAVLVEISTPKGSLGTYLIPKQTEADRANKIEDQSFTFDKKQWQMAMLFAPVMGGTVLAVSAAGDMGGDSMATFPESEMQTHKVLKTDILPFTLKVKGYWPKCQLFKYPGRNSIEPHVTQGLLKNTFVTPGPLVTDSDHRNLPAVVIELTNNNGSLGTWLLWSTPNRTADEVQIGGKVFEMAFQFKRYYEPYTIGLKKFTHDSYKGTPIPKNFASRVRVINPQKKEDREVVIKMNYPLRYAGNTYYQAGFDERRADETILEVVTNPGWLTPYLACILVGLGLIIQFSMHLVGFALKRRKA
jgi:hypothetical protein